MSEKAETIQTWRVKGVLAGQGPTFRSIQNALVEAAELLDGDGDEEVTITGEKMTQEEYDGLPEFQGY